VVEKQTVDSWQAEISGSKSTGGSRQLEVFLRIMDWRGGIIQSCSRRESGLAFTNYSRMLFELADTGWHHMKGLIKLAALLVVVSVCLFGHVLNSQSGIFRELQVSLLSLQWLLLVCVGFL
jgi:hypothetical protein